MSDGLAWAILILASYIVGSIPFGLLIGLARGVDIREHGSGNIGATNAGRVLGRKWGLLSFLLDVAKGAAPVLVAGWTMGLISNPDPAPGASALWLGVAAGTVIGHMFSVFLRFKGGKGVATGLGAMLGVWPHLTIAAVLAGLTWLVAIRVSRYVSVSSIVAAGSLGLWVLGVRLVRSGLDPDLGVRGVWPFALAALLLGGLVIVKHRGNLRRLRAGTEPRVGTPVSPDEPPAR